MFITVHAGMLTLVSGSAVFPRNSWNDCVVHVRHVCYEVLCTKVCFRDKSWVDIITGTKPAMGMLRDKNNLLIGVSPGVVQCYKKQLEGTAT